MTSDDDRPPPIWAPRDDETEDWSTLADHPEPTWADEPTDNLRQAAPEDHAPPEPIPSRRGWSRRSRAKNAGAQALQPTDDQEQARLDDRKRSRRASSDAELSGDGPNRPAGRFGRGRRQADERASAALPDDREQARRPGDDSERADLTGNDREQASPDAVPAEHAQPDDASDRPTEQWDAKGDASTPMNEWNVFDEDHSYPAPVDPYHDRDGYPATGHGYFPTDPLPGWNAPHERPARKPRNRRKILVGAAAVLLLAGLVTAIIEAPRMVTPTASAGSQNQQRSQDGTGLTAPVDGRTEASFEVVDGATAIKVHAGDLGQDLYRVDAAQGSGLKPRVETDNGTLKLFLASDGSQGSAAVDVTLTTKVRWTLTMAGGTSQTVVDLTGADVTTVDLSGGSSKIDLTLPVPKALVDVKMTGGVDQFLLRLPGATPLRVTVGSGAGAVTLDGETHRGIGPGASFTTNGWSDGSAGVDLQAQAGLAALIVTAS